MSSANLFANLAPCPVAEAMAQVTEAMRRREGSGSKKWLNYRSGLKNNQNLY